MRGVILFILLSGSLLFAQEMPKQSQIDSLKSVVKSLQEQINQIQQKTARQELERLRRAAELEARTKARKPEKLATKIFREGSRSLQALNPEISVTGDMLTRYLLEAPHFNDEARSGFLFRVLGLHFQSNLDPFSFAKVAVEFGAEGVGVGEAYITWINPLPNINLTMGKFRQQFGVINRWHQHALDQIAFPLPIQKYMGEEGLNQAGLSLNWLMPALTAHANELTLQLTNSTNPKLFSGEEFGLPATLLHWKNYYDLNRDTYFEWGFTGLAGPNDDFGFTFDRHHYWTYLLGADFTLSWSPVNQALYHGFTWRSELFYLDKDDFASGKRIKALGGFSYLDYRLSRRIIIGIRGDIAQPPVPDNSNRYLYQVVPYLTFWQSEFVFLRLQFNHLQGHNLDEKDNRFVLQIDWAVGPHKHERY